MIRRMIKWKPFYSVPGIEKIAKEINEEKEKIDRPIILNSRDINYNIEIALNKKSDVTIKYYDYGFLKIKTGKITNINTIYKYLEINNKRIYFKNIIKLDIK